MRSPAGSAFRARRFYRFEKGELAKIETLEKLAELLSVSVPTLLGVGVEYVASAVSYFERMRQIEEASEHIIVLAGPISYLLASDAFDQALGDILREEHPRRARAASARSPRSRRSPRCCASARIIAAPARS